jgi:hypothetical protein
MPLRSNHSLLIIFLSLAFLGQACKKESVPFSDNSAVYFPLTEGRFCIYQVDSIVHAESDNNNDDSVFSYNYQVMEVLDSSWWDGSGRFVQAVLRYYRPDGNSSWQVTSVWTQYRNASGAYRTEDNIPYQKMAFPIASTAVWNGNAANTLDDEYYRYDGTHQPVTIEGLDFDSVTTVIQRDEDNYVERFYGEERYAADIGLVYRRLDRLGKRNGQVVKGTEFTMKVISFGFLP